MTGGISAAGSAWATPPTTVPRLRIAGCPISRTASTRSGASRSATDERVTVSWRTSGPIVSWPPLLDRLAGLVAQPR
jgi:hypothetical protein